MWTVIPGVLLTGFAIVEVFKDLFHPTASGSLSDYIGRTVFRLFRRWPSRLSTAGPISLVLVMLCWALSLALGFALIYWGFFPDDFHVQTGRSPSAEHGFWSVLYFSLQVLTTLGFGDFAPISGWLRVLVTLHALIGYSLITASISWIVLLYPALGRMRSFARRVGTLVEAERRTNIPVISNDAQYVLGNMTDHVVRARVDLIHYPIIYYFHSESDQASVSQSIPHLLRFAREGSKPQYSERVRFAAAALQIALDDLASILSERFLPIHTNDPDSVFRAYREDHVSTD